MAMKYDAITVDANIFGHNGWHPERGILAQLGQFQSGSAQFVLSEIVIRELVKHLTEKVEEAKDSLKKAVREAPKHSILTVDELKQIDAMVNSMASPKDIVQERIKLFSEKTGMKIIPAELTDITSLVRRYFKPLAPFENSAKKKNEFPDAIALLSLEKWAAEEGKRLLAISKDAGWINYGKDSQWIDVEGDLAKSLETFQKHADEAHQVIASLLKGVKTGEREDLKSEIFDYLASTVNDLGIHPEAESAFQFELVWGEISFQDFEFSCPDEMPDFTLVRVGREKIIVQVELEIQVGAEGEFELAAWDSIDRDYVGLGSSSSQTDTEFSAKALITFEGDFSKDPKELMITMVELLASDVSIYFGQLDLDYGDGEYED